MRGGEDATTVENELGAVHKILEYKLRAFLAHVQRREIEKAFDEAGAFEE